MPRCPTRVGQTYKLLLRRDKVGDDGEASENPEDWGECHSDCPLRAYRDNQVRLGIKRGGCKHHHRDHLELCNLSFLGDQELLGDMRSLAKERPSLAKTYNIGHSVLGQNLQVGLKF